MSYEEFCLYCTGNDKNEVQECRDKNCPFFPFRFGGLGEDDGRKLATDILKDTGVIT